MEFSLNFVIFTYMKIRETDKQLYLVDGERKMRGKELALAILGSGLGVTSIKEGSVIVFEFRVFEFSRIVRYMFQTKKDLNVLRLNDASYVNYLAGSVIDLQTGKPVEKVSYAPRFKQCRFPSLDELHLYEQFSTI